MGEQVVFPMNFEKYKALGEKEVANKNFQLAGFHFQKAYDLLPSFEVNKQLAACLIEIGQFSEALKIVSEMKNDYLHNEADAALYIKALLGQKYFVQAHQIVNRQKAEPFWQEEYEAICQAEKYSQLFEQEEVRRKKAQLSEFFSFSNLDQLAFLKENRFLSQEDFFAGVLPYLTDVRIHGIVRASLLEIVRDLNLQAAVDFRRFDGNVASVALAELPEIREKKMVVKIKNWLKEELEQNNPLLVPVLEEELTFHLSIFYPYAEQIIVQPAFWLQALVSIYDPTSSFVLNEEEQKQVAAYKLIQEKIQDEIQRFITE